MKFVQCVGFRMEAIDGEIGAGHVILGSIVHVLNVMASGGIGIVRVSANHQVVSLQVFSVKLIPKKDAEPYYVNDWRPISLLNCDYKLVTKAVANRRKQVLPKFIDNDQTGFLKGRFIGENIRLVDSVINFTAAKNIPGPLVFLDFEKAFDTVEWPFIQKTYQHFNFGPSIISWIKLFYHDIETCILNNGWSSNFFQTRKRGKTRLSAVTLFVHSMCRSPCGRNKK